MPTTITYKQLESILTEGDTVHTFRDGGFMLVGADWDKKKLLKTAKKYEKTIELTGPGARGMGHGVAIRDDMGMLFIETDEEKLSAIDPRE